MLRDCFTASMVQPPPLYTSSIAPNGTEEAPSQSIEGMAKAHGAAAALSPDGGYTSDTHEEPADRKKKKAMVGESPPQAWSSFFLRYI